MTEAKDTVKPEIDPDRVFQYVHNLNQDSLMAYLERVKLAQAEISFEAGMQEVVDWVVEHRNTSRYWQWENDLVWQNFLKRKGLK